MRVWREVNMSNTKVSLVGCAALVVVTMFATAAGADSTWLQSWQRQNKTWRAVHLYGATHEKLGELQQLVVEGLAPMGVNALVLEVGYGFAFKSRPQMADPQGLTAQDARQLTELCRKHGIRLIPLMNCLGHQSSRDKTHAFLRNYPQFDETPQVPASNEGIYFREWCPLHPEVNAVVFDLMDELIEAFNADAFHVGMDEVFLIGNEKCPRCKGKNPGELFAKAVNDYHRHLVEDKGIEMLMWGDRLLNEEVMKYGNIWESSSTGSHTAVDLIPKDIIVCDWHYTTRDDYPSVRFFQQKGFRVLPATYKDPQAAEALLKCARKDATDRMLGMLFTSWGVKAGGGDLLAALKGQETEGISETVKGVAGAMKLCLGKVGDNSSSAEIAVIPRPAEMKVTAGNFRLKDTTRILYEKGSVELARIANYLAERLRPATGIAMVVLEAAESAPQADTILLTTKGTDQGLGDEGYELTVSADSVILRAAQPAGVFYGTQTIRQLLPAEIESGKKVLTVEWTIPCVQIKDKPRFAWRGSLLDCCRHFMSKDFLKRYIDLLAYHKMNRFHWHLTEDQGWRIEIKKYPRLTEVAAWRGEDKYGGYYTQQDVRDIVEYAASRYVMVVPEIEMPGHSQAALAAYPELSCTGGPFEVATNWGVIKDVYCAGNDRVFEFLQDVLSEVIELFPAPYVHIGGDECPKDRWQKCPRCQARIKAKGLKDEHELQSYFVKRIEKFLLSKNRRLIGWDEILEGGLAPAATVQSWRGISGGIAAATSGHDVIMSPTSHCYLDYSHGRISIEKIYSFEPVPQELTAEQAVHILGGEGNMWTEHAPQELVDYRVYPRLTALAEVLWSPKEQRSWQDFSQRLDSHYRRLDVLGVDYFKPMELKQVGQWTPQQMSTEFTTLQWDITEYVGDLKPGSDFYIGLDYQKGAYGIAVEWVALLQDGKEISRDTHEAFSGSQKRNNIYKLRLGPAAGGQAAARYTIQAKLRSDGGTDSQGAVWLSKQPPRPDGV
jgi:hexosaminidase